MYRKVWAGSRDSPDDKRKSFDAVKDNQRCHEKAESPVIVSRKEPEGLAEKGKNDGNDKSAKKDGINDFAPSIEKLERAAAAGED